MQPQKTKIKELQKQSKSLSGSLKKKLKETVVVIHNLVAQKHRLIDANNRLEAEVKTLCQFDGEKEKLELSEQKRQFSPKKAKRMQY